MKIKKLHLENFRCHELLDMDFNENINVIRKANFYGKTTILNSILWVLTGKPLTGEKNYYPKPIKDGEEVHGVTSVAELTFYDSTVLKKEFAEKWEKKRGSNDKTFTGNTIKCYINEVPYTATNYDKWIEENIADKDKLQSLLNPEWWCNNLPDGYGWEKRRECLLEMLDVDTTSLMTDEIKLILDSQSEDDAKKRIKSQLKKINSDLQDIPVRIDEVKKQLEDIPTESIDELKTEIDLLEQEKLEAQKQIANIEQGDEQQTYARNAYNDALSKLEQTRAEYTIEYSKAIESSNKLANEAMEKKHKAETLFLEAKRECEELELAIAYKKCELDKLRDEYNKEIETSFSIANMNCPTCKQVIPKSQVEQSQADFNRNKSEKLEKLKKEGLKIKKELEQLETKLVKAKENVIILEDSVNGIEVPEIKKVIEFENTEKYEELKNQVNIAKLAMRENKTTKLLVEPYKKLIQDKTEEQNKLRIKVGFIENTVGLNARIDELKQEERKLSELYAEFEGKLYLIEQYIKNKIGLLDNAIEQKFKNLRFRMFKENIGNDGITDTCDVMISTEKGGLIPYSSGSTSEKIIANIELVKVLSDFWGIETFMLIDNAEAISENNRPITGNMQTIWAEVKED